MTERTGAAFREALDAHLAADAAPGLTPRQADLEERAAQTHAELREAAQAHVDEFGAVGRQGAPAALAAEYERVRNDPQAPPGLVRATEETLATASLVAEYERLRDDPAADRAAVTAAAEALATARQAHRAAAGQWLPQVIAGTGG